MEYRFVCEQVPHRWAELQPLLVLHVGVSARDTVITLERLAHNTGYCKDDVAKSCPPGNTCVEAAPVELSTSFNLDKVVQAARKASNEQSSGLDFDISRDAGRYLCDFIYYKSLHGMSGKSLFIHVSPQG